MNCTTAESLEGASKRPSYAAFAVAVLVAMFGANTAHAQYDFPHNLTNRLDGTWIQSEQHSKKIIVLINGWTNENRENAPYDAYEHGEWPYLLNTLKVKLQGTEWKLVTYRWEKDASTGLWQPNAAWAGSAYLNAVQAATNADAHGSNLGSLLQGVAPELREVHFIAHSAGSWAARSAARYLLQSNPNVVVQVTLLDPFIPDAHFGYTTGLSTNAMSAMISFPGAERLRRLENYLADDLLTVSTGEAFVWRSNRDILRQKVDWQGANGYHYSTHSGPIKFYADTVAATIPGTPLPPGLSPYLAAYPPFSYSEVGWFRSISLENPKIVVQPESPKSATIGGSVSLSISAASVSNYQWFKNGEIIGGADSSTLTLTNVSQSDAADYVVRVRNNSYGQVFSSIARVIVNLPKPAAPANLSALAVSTSQINLKWTDVSNESNYLVERKTLSGSYSTVKSLGADTTAWSDTTVSPGTSYFYQVKARNSAGASEPSTAVPATTASAGANYPLSIASSNPNNGVSVSSFVGTANFLSANTPTSRSFAAGTVVGVTCPQALATGQVFHKWQLDGIDYSFATYVTVTMNAAHTLTAVFGTSAPASRTLSSLAVEGPSSLNERSSAQYRARATYNDGSSGYIAAAWSEDSSYTTIGSNGVLDAGAVSSDKSIEVRAQYSEGGVTLSKIKSVTIENIDSVASYTLTRNTTGGGAIGYSPSGSSYPAGTVVSLHANADGSYIFSHWTGDASGTDDDITVVMDRNRSVTANFVLDPSEGALRVNLSPAQAVAEGAQWRFDNFTSWRDSGNTQTNISPRVNRNVHFKAIPGWIAPDDIKTSIVGTQTTVVNASYREILGAIQVTITPVEAAAAGARWRLDGGDWRDSGTTVNNVAPGNRIIEFQGIPGWQTPATQVLAVTRGNPSVSTGIYGAPIGQTLISSIMPNTGPIEGGIIVTVDGVGFTPSTSVTFGGVAATGVNVLSNSRLTAILPPRATYGSVTVAVTSGGQTATRLNGFSYDIPLGMNMTLLSQIGGRIRAVAVSGTSVLYGEGNSLVFADFANPSVPIVRGRLVLPGLVRDIQIVGNHAIVANAGSGLQIIDISNPVAMGKIGFYDTPGTASRLAIDGNLAYVADSSGGLQIIDFVDRAAPRRVGGFEGEALDVGFSIIGGRKILCVVTYPNGVVVLDATDVTAIQQLSAIESTVPVRTLTLSGQTLVVTGRRADNPTNADGKVYSLANPSLPVKTREGFSSFDDVGIISGNTYYKGRSDLAIYNLNNNPPSRTGLLDLPGTTSGMALNGTTLYMANGDAGLIAINVADLSAPAIRSTINNGFGAGGITVLNGTAYVAFGGDSSSTSVTAFPVVTAFNVTDPRNPQRAGTASFFSTVERLIPAGNFLLGTTQSRGIPTFNIQTPLNPAFLSARAADRYTHGATKLGNNIVLSGGTLGSGPSYPLLTVIDGGNVNNSTPLSTYQLSTSIGIGQAVITRGSAVFVFLYDQGLRVVDYTNISSPQIIGTLDFPGFSSHAAISADGRYIYAADFANGLRILDCLNPAAPALLATYTRNGNTSGRAVVVQGDLVFYADSGGLNVLDCTDPLNPVVVAAYDTPGSPYDIFVDGTNVFLADASGGVQILELGDLSRPIIEITTPTRNSLYETAAATIDISGTASDGQGIAQVTWVNDRAGGGAAAGTTVWSATGIRLMSGDNNILVTAQDTAGNLTSDTITVRSMQPDTTAPVITITGPKPDNQYEVGSPSITISGNAADSTGVLDIVWSNNRGGTGAVTGTANWTANLHLLEGPNIITVTARDPAGNIGMQTQTIVFAPIDNTAPAVTIDFPTFEPIYVTTQSALSLSGTASDNREVTEVRWQNDRGGNGTVEGFTEWWVNDLSLQLGNNVITVTAKDAAGNVTTDTLVVNRSVPEPVFVSLSITGPNSVAEISATQYAAVASFDNGASETVTALWSGGSDAASISSTGLLTANEVLSDTAAQIFASYISGGISISTSKFVTVLNTTPLPTPTPVPTPSPTPALPGAVGNVSTRLPVGAGDDVLIEGFIVQGPVGSTKKIMVRALGPFLAQFGISDALPNPTLEIYEGNTLIAINNDWRNTQVEGIITGDQSAEIEGSGLAPANNLESAIIAELNPGSYTAVVRGLSNTVGTGIVDAYDMSAASPARLANIATRGLIQPGDKLMIAGVIIQNGSVSAVVRAIGPSLSAFGISNALPDTTLQLKDQNGAIVMENDNWQTNQKTELEQTGLQPGHDLEAALVVTLPPGQYTAQVRGQNESTGTGVVEVYFLQ